MTVREESYESLNTKFSSILVCLNEGTEPISTDYEAVNLTISHHFTNASLKQTIYFVKKINKHIFRYY